MPNTDRAANMRWFHGLIRAQFAASSRLVGHYRPERNKDQLDAARTMVEIRKPRFEKGYPHQYC